MEFQSKYKMADKFKMRRGMKKWKILFGTKDNSVFELTRKMWSDIQSNKELDLQLIDENEYNVDKNKDLKDNDTNNSLDNEKVCAN